MNILYDKIVIYDQTGDGEFHDLYKGESKNIPSKLLEVKVKSIGARKKGILDIWVEKEI